MALYTIPGVYTQEQLNPISNSVASPGASTAAFVGVTGGGPSGPILISSWGQYQALFPSSEDPEIDDLGAAVYTYFQNGGSPCYVVRAFAGDATQATLAVVTAADSDDNSFTVNAIAPGAWASESDGPATVYITVTPTTADRFDFVVQVGSGTSLIAQEQFIDLCLNPSDPRNAVSIINSPTVGSNYVNISPDWTGQYDGTADAPAAVTKSPLTGGGDGSQTPDPGTSVTLLDNLALGTNLVVNLPAASATSVGEAVTWADGLGTPFIVADVLQPAQGENEAASVSAINTYVTELAATSSRVAIYAPWLYVSDPSSAAGALRITAPGGSVVANYLTSERAYGVQKAPAGTVTQLVGVIQPYLNYTQSDQDTLYTEQVNLIQTRPGSGVCIWGARTQSTGYPDKYVPIRRTLISVESGLSALTQFAVFEDNIPTLWETITATCEDYLGGLLQAGTLAGNSAKESYYVICDSTNNTSQSIQSGIVNIEVGVALQFPSEFIVIRIGQMPSGSTTSDNLGS